MTWLFAPRSFLILSEFLAAWKKARSVSPWFYCSGLPSRSSRAGQPAFARWASAWQPSLASRAKAGGPGRTRTCNQTVMSAAAFREMRENSTIFVPFHARSCVFVQGVSVGVLVGSLAPPERLQLDEHVGFLVKTRSAAGHRMRDDSYLYSVPYLRPIS